MRTYRRKKYFVKKNFQARFILKFLVLSSIASILSILLFNYLAYRKIDSVLFSMRIPASGAGELLLKEAFYSNLFAIAVVVIMVMITVRGIFHKIARPLYAIRANLQKIRSGDLSLKIALRRGDEFKDVADELNGMILGLHQRFTEIKGNAQQLSEYARELKDLSGDKNKERLEALKEQVRAVEETLEKFQR
ncbi:MAG: methyl-accepting chemotaxis protein [Nitrospirae bacterium]|nr:methyl-accepting chemotaxis protein [Nitrospirota bacterium]